MRPVLHVCVTCRAGRALAEGEIAPGRLLLDRIVSRGTLREQTFPELRRELGPEYRPDYRPDIREVACLAACEHGCTATIASPGKWRILLGHLDPSLADDLLDYAERYAASEKGTVLPSARAPSLRHAILGRIPA